MFKLSNFERALISFIFIYQVLVLEVKKTTFISTQFFDKVVNENLSSFCEMSPKHGSCGSEKVLNDAKEKGEAKGERREGKKTMQ